jgi:hypothetical protein
MAYSPIDRNPSGIVYFGTAASDQVFESNANFTFDGTSLVAPNIKLPNGGKIGSASQTGILTLGSDGIATFSSGVVIAGDLTVNGDVVTLNTATLTVEDNIILLNKNVTGVPSLDAGLEIERGDSTNVKLYYDEGTDQWKFTNDGSTYYAIPTGVAATSFTLAGDGGTSQTLTSGDTITVAGGSGITTVAGATDTMTVHLNVDNSTVEVNADILRVKDSGITSSKIAATAVGETQLANSAVTANKIASDAVTTAKILDSNVTTGKIANGAITEAKIVRTVDSSFSANETIASDINLVAAGAGGITIKLPAPASGKMVIVKKTDSAAGSVTISRNSTDTIDGATSKVLYYQYEALTFVSDGTNWFIV